MIWAGEGSMRQWKRLVFYLLLNILVSAATTLTVMSLWDRNQNGDAPEPVLPEVSPTLAASEEDTPALPTPSIPTLALQTYLVQPGDTLGSIALELDVSVDTLMNINGFTDPDLLGAGMILFVPADNPGSGEQPDSEPAQPQQIPAGEALIEIASVIGAGDLMTERVLLRRIGEGEISLSGWGLQSESGEVYTFPQLILYKDGAVNVHTAAGTDTVIDLYWGQDEAMWNAGSQVRLLDPAGNLHAIYTVP